MKVDNVFIYLLTVVNFKKKKKIPPFLAEAKITCGFETQEAHILILLLSNTASSAVYSNLGAEFKAQINNGW